MAGKLTTLYLYKTFAGIALTDTSDDILYNRLIAEISDAIAVATDRTFALTTYMTWLDGSGTDCMFLPEWPVRTIYKIATSYDNVLKVQYTGSGLHADISIDDTNVILHSMDSTGTEQTDTISLAANKTISTLASAIDAVSDWTGTAESSFGNTASSLIRKIMGWNVLTPAFVYLQTPREGGIDVRIAEDTNRCIERITGAIFPEGQSNIFAWYKAGYTLPVDNQSHSQLATAGDLPDGLILVTNQIIKDIYDGRKNDGNLKSEKIGDYSYTRADISSAIKNRWTDLARYARVEI